MRELIGRLEVVDDDAASALRVIAHFDGLVNERASAPAMVRAAAALAGCPAAWHDSESGVTRRLDPAGRSRLAGCPGRLASGHPRDEPGRRSLARTTGRTGAAGPAHPGTARQGAGHDGWPPGRLRPRGARRPRRLRRGPHGRRAPSRGRGAGTPRPGNGVGGRPDGHGSLGTPSGLRQQRDGRPAEPPRHRAGSSSFLPGRVRGRCRARPPAGSGTRSHRIAAQRFRHGSDRDHSLRGPRRPSPRSPSWSRPSRPSRCRTSPSSTGSCRSTRGYRTPSQRSSGTGVCGKPRLRCTCITPRSRSGSPGSRAGSGSHCWAVQVGSGSRSPFRCGGSPAPAPADAHTSERVGRQRRRSPRLAEVDHHGVAVADVAGEQRRASRSPISRCTSRRSGRAP